MALNGGAEKVLDEALRGNIKSLFRSLESDVFGACRMIAVPGGAPIKSANLLLLGLGELQRFSIQNLHVAIRAATERSLTQNFATIATPVIGISDHVGLPVEEAYGSALHSVLSVLTDYVRTSGSHPATTNVTFFDNSRQKVSTFEGLTARVLRNMGANFEMFSNALYEIDLSGSPRTVGTAPGGPDGRQETQSRRPTVFVSHSSKDKWFANELVNELGDLPIHVFYDEQSIAAGEDIAERIIQGLKQCDCVVLVLSKNSADSDWVTSEISAARALDKLIIPVKLDEAKPPIFATGVRWVDATNPFKGVRSIRKHLEQRYES